MRIYFLSFILFVLFPSLVIGQFGYGKISEIDALKTRKLIVIVEEPQERVIKKLQRKKQIDKIEVYKKAINDYNSKMKAVVEKFWWFSKNGFEYKTFKEANELRKNKETDKEYAVLYCVTAAMYTSAFSGNSGVVESSGLDWTADIEDQSKDRDFYDSYTQMKVSLLDDLNKVWKPIWYVALPDIFPTTTSLIFGMQNLQVYMDFRVRKKENKEDISAMGELKASVKKNHPNLNTKTLLLREDILAKGMDKDKIAAVYPYKFEIVNKERMDSIVFSSDDNYLYALVIPSIVANSRANEVIYIDEIFLASNNEVCAYSMPNMAAHVAELFAGVSRVGNGKKNIGEKNLKAFVSGGD